MTGPFDEDRRRRWIEWEATFWSTVQTSLGDSGSGGAARLFESVWVMLNPIEVGVVNIGICRSPQHGEGRFLGYSFNALWETDPPEGVADWAIRYAKRVLEDSLFFRPS
jgi:hypothetical protein